MSIVSRCLTDIFANLTSGNLKMEYEYVQIYMGVFTDLMSSNENGADREPPKIVENRDGTVYLSNVTTKEASSRDQILRDLERGAARRATRAQDLNHVSSRSHTILCLRLKNQKVVPSSLLCTWWT